MGNIPIPKRAEGTPWWKKLLDVVTFGAAAVAAPFTGGSSLAAAIPAVAVATKLATDPISNSIVKSRNKYVAPVSGTDKIETNLGVTPPTVPSSPIISSPPTRPESMIPAPNTPGLEMPQRPNALNMPEKISSSPATFGQVARGVNTGLGMANNAMNVISAFKSPPKPQAVPLQSDLQMASIDNPAQQLLAVRDAMNAVKFMPATDQGTMMNYLTQTRDELRRRLG
jgi:hypothetical protein